MGDKADDILRSLNFTQDDRNKYSPVKNKLNCHFVKRRNIIFEHAKFYMCKQEEGELVGVFNTDLYLLAEHCAYDTLHNEMICD